MAERSNAKRAQLLVVNRLQVGWQGQKVDVSELGGVGGADSLYTCSNHVLPAAAGPALLVEDDDGLRCHCALKMLHAFLPPASLENNIFEKILFST